MYFILKKNRDKVQKGRTFLVNGTYFCYLCKRIKIAWYEKSEDNRP